MRAKILSSSSTFNGVSYNTNKTQNEKGELMKFRNFGYLQDNDNISPQEMKNFLIAHSARNSAVKNKQFHAMISCKGREYNKHELTNIAHEWLDKMGYGNNPFLIVFHKDTDNNHVHIVSSRVDKQGNKISDSFEKLKSQRIINEIMRVDTKQELSDAIEKLTSYSFSTKSQAFLLLESLGYKLKERENQIDVIKYGTVQGKIEAELIQNRIKAFTHDSDRAKALNAIFYRYSNIYNSDPIPVFEKLPSNKQGKHIGYQSDLASYLKDKHGVELIFHGKDGKSPYGYTVIDHSRKTIHKGSKIMTMGRLCEKKGQQKPYDPERKEPITNKYLLENRVKLRSAMHDFSSLKKGLAHYSYDIVSTDKGAHLNSKNGSIPLKEILDSIESEKVLGMLQEENNLPEKSTDSKQGTFPTIPIFTISDDVDDEAIHGRDRQRKRKTDRKNTR